MAVSRLVKNIICNLKVVFLLVKADIVAQSNIYDSVLRPLMKKGWRMNSSHVLLFMDVPYFMLGCNFLYDVYSKNHPRLQRN